MNPTHRSTDASPESAQSRSIAADGAARDRPLPRSRAGACIALAHAALFLVTLAVLSVAIGWPGVLRLPPATVFERIREADVATSVGYFSYLLSSLLMVPLAFVLRDAFQRGGVFGWWMDALTFLGAAAGVLKTLGIVRWLLAMPALANEHAKSGTESERKVIEAVYLGVNGYGGSVGELLGVALYSGVWFAGISAVLLLSFRERFVGGFGMLVAALTLCLALRPVFPGIGAVEAVGGPLWVLWLACLSAALWRGRAQRATR